MVAVATTTSADADAFLQGLYYPHDEPTEAAYQACLAHKLGAYQATPATARLFQHYLAQINAYKVVEVGTILGYTAIRMARVIPVNGMIWTLALNHQEGSQAWSFATAAGVGQKIVGMLGGTMVLPMMAPYGPFDAVVLSADVANYDRYAQWAPTVIRPGGVLIVNHARPKDGPAGEPVRKLHTVIHEHFDVVYVPTPEGVIHAVRK